MWKFRGGGRGANLPIFMMWICLTVLLTLLACFSLETLVAKALPLMAHAVTVTVGYKALILRDVAFRSLPSNEALALATIVVSVPFAQHRTDICRKRVDNTGKVYFRYLGKYCNQCKNWPFNRKFIQILGVKFNISGVWDSLTLRNAIRGYTQDLQDYCPTFFTLWTIFPCVMWMTNTVAIDAHAMSAATARTILCPVNYKEETIKICISFQKSSDQKYEMFISEYFWHTLSLQYFQWDF